MDTFLVGQVAVFSDLITDPANNDAPVSDSTEVITVYKPDNTTVVPTVIHPGQLDPNAYDVHVTFDQPGYWTIASNSTALGAGAQRLQVYVEPIP